MHTISLLAVLASLCLALASPLPHTGSLHSQPVSFAGYVDDTNPLAVRFDWSGVEIHAVVSAATSISVVLTDQGNEYNVFLNGVNVTRIVTNAVTTQYLVAQNLNPKLNYTVRITKRTEADVGVATFHGFALSNELAGSEETPRLLPVERAGAAATKKIAFFGDSITCGYGNMEQAPCQFSPDTEDNLLAYGGIVGSMLNADIFTQSWSGKGVVHNYGDPSAVSANPMPSYLLQSVANDPLSRWNFSRWTPDAAVINLGTNDFSSSTVRPDNQTFINAYVSYIASIRTAFGRSEEQLPVFVVCGPVQTGWPCINVLTVAELVPHVHFVDMEQIMSTPEDVGCDGHPSSLAQKKMADILVLAMRYVLNW